MEYQSYACVVSVLLSYLVFSADTVRERSLYPHANFTELRICKLDPYTNRFS